MNKMDLKLKKNGRALRENTQFKSVYFFGVGFNGEMLSKN